MNDPRQQQQLLADVLGEGFPSEFREGLLHETLHLARRRRRFRQVRTIASAAAVVAVLSIVIWRQPPPTQRPPSSPAKPYILVRTLPLPRASWVETRPLSATSLIASVSTHNIVTTAATRAVVHEINDDQLLALAPKPAVLVRRGPHLAELVFVSRFAQEHSRQN